MNRPVLKLSSVICLILCLQMIYSQHSHSGPSNSTPSASELNILDPVNLRPYMFKTQITGELNVMKPCKLNTKINGTVFSQSYQIDMVKTKLQILPACYNKTTVYAYAGKTNKGYKASYPGPAIFATKDKPIRVTWRNSIPGQHILPVEYGFPFDLTKIFRQQVPTVPHAHGLAVQTSSDGQPESYWTKSGYRAPLYQTEEKSCAKNEAIYHYPNQQDGGNNWYHYHTLGITRLNVYAGLAGFYKIFDPYSKHEKRIVKTYGQCVRESQTKFLLITDKTFKKNGQLYYPDKSQNPRFKHWVPEFFGNTMLVNGVLYPKMTLKQQKYRFVLLNTCNSRFLIVSFENNGKKIPMELIRADSDYYNQEVMVEEISSGIGARMEFILDLTNVQGQVVFKNRAPGAPGTPNPTHNQEFNGQLMKIYLPVLCKKSRTTDSTNLRQTVQAKPAQPTKPVMYTSTPYPRFSQGEKVFPTLIEIMDDKGQVEAVLINGMRMMTTEKMNGGMHGSMGNNDMKMGNMGVNNQMCHNSTFKVGKTYDFYIVNLTPDGHPIHFHLINFQKVKQFKFDVEAYKAKYFALNGKPDIHGYIYSPIQINPEPFRTGEDQFPKDNQKVFRDVIGVAPGYVSVFRIKFAKNDGTLWKSFDARGQRYVWHCHILEHEDNEMMQHFCLK